MIRLIKIRAHDDHARAHTSQRDTAGARLHRSTASRTAVFFTLAFTLCLVLITSCVTVPDPNQPPLPPPPRPIPDQPSRMVVNRVSFNVTLYAKDMNANGRGDRVDATVYLWSQPYAFPLYIDGTLKVHMYKTGTYKEDGGTPIRTWTFTENDLRLARREALPGPCYLITISLLDGDTTGKGDDIGLNSADVVAEFQQVGQPPVRSGISTIHLDSTH